MNGYLVMAIIIPWVFWGIVMGLLIMANRSWINVLLMPVALTVLILAIAGLASAQDAFWASLVLHMLLLIMFLRSFASFRRDKNNNEKLQG